MSPFEDPRNHIFSFVARRPAGHYRSVYRYRLLSEVAARTEAEARRLWAEGYQPPLYPGETLTVIQQARG